MEEKARAPAGCRGESGPGAGVSVPGECVPAGAHSSTAGLSSAQHWGTGEKGASLPCSRNLLVLTALGPTG